MFRAETCAVRLRGYNNNNEKLLSAKSLKPRVQKAALGASTQYNKYVLYRKAKIQKTKLFWVTGKNIY